MIFPACRSTPRGESSPVITGVRLPWPPPASAGAATSPAPASASAATAAMRVRTPTANPLTVCLPRRGSPSTDALSQHQITIRSTGKRNYNHLCTPDHRCDQPKVSALQPSVHTTQIPQQQPRPGEFGAAAGAGILLVGLVRGGLVGDGEVGIRGLA